MMEFEAIYWWEMHRCLNKLCFLSYPVESFKHKKTTAAFPSCGLC